MTGEIDGGEYGWEPFLFFVGTFRIAFSDAVQNPLCASLLVQNDLISHSCRQMTTIRVVGILALAAAAAAVGAALMRLKMNAELMVRQLRKTQRECPSDGPFVLLLHAGPG